MNYSTQFLQIPSWSTASISPHDIEAELDFSSLSAHLCVCRDVYRGQPKLQLAFYSLDSFISSRFVTTVFVFVTLVATATVLI
jgi:hypothetical protein